MLRRPEHTRTCTLTATDRPPTLMLDLTRSTCTSWSCTPPSWLAKHQMLLRAYSGLQLAAAALGQLCARTRTHTELRRQLQVSSKARPHIDKADDRLWVCGASKAHDDAPGPVHKALPALEALHEHDLGAHFELQRGPHLHTMQMEALLWQCRCAGKLQKLRCW